MAEGLAARRQSKCTKRTDVDPRTILDLEEFPETSISLN